MEFVDIEQKTPKTVDDVQDTTKEVSPPTPKRMSPVTSPVYTPEQLNIGNSEFDDSNKKENRSYRRSRISNRHAPYQPRKPPSIEKIFR